MQDRLALARELAGALSGIEIDLISLADGSLASAMDKNFYNFSIFPIPEQRIRGYLKGLDTGCIYLFTNDLLLNFLVIRVPGKTEFLMAGPCQEHFSESRIRTILRPHGFPAELLQRIISYCRWQPVLSREQLHRLGLVLARNVLDLPDPVRYESIQAVTLSGHTAFLPPERYVEQSEIRRVEMRYEASAALTEAVKQGNLGLALHMIQGIQSGVTAMIRNPDPLRNAQNMCIVLNTQLRHALEERRIHPYRLDAVSGEIGQQIERLKSLEEAGKFFAHIIRRYCDLALEKNFAHLEPFSRQVVIYIKNHLTDNLTVKDTAAALLVNANYLSGKFHREVGMTFTDFVNAQRTAQAATLLRHTAMQVQQIAATVGYNNASYFTKQFLRFYKTTPKAYRDQRDPQINRMG